MQNQKRAQKAPNATKAKAALTRARGTLPRNGGLLERRGGRMHFKPKLNPTERKAQAEARAALAGRARHAVATLGAKALAAHRSFWNLKTKPSGRARHVDRTWGETSREHVRRDKADVAAARREMEEHLKAPDSGRAKAAAWGSRSAAASLDTFERQVREGRDWGRARPKLHGHARGKTCPKCRGT